MINQKHTRCCKGGLGACLNELDAAFTELGLVLNETTWVSDDSKKRRLVCNMEDLNFAWLESTAETKPCNDILRLLRTHAFSMDKRHADRAHSKARMTTQSSEEVRSALLSCITADVCRELPPDVRELICHVKKCTKEKKTNLELPESVLKESAPRKETLMDKNNKQEMPKQYSSAVNFISGMDEEDHDAVNNFLLEAESSSDNSERGACMTVMAEQNNNDVLGVDVSAAKHRKMLNLTTRDGCHVMVFDNGADTTLLGKGWNVISEHPT